MAARIPAKGTPLLEADGRSINQQWFDFLTYVDKQISLGLSGQVDVKLTSLANNQVLIWKSADSKWENGSN